MDFLFDDKRPIYIQLVEQLKIAIATGIYKPGEKIPSVREYALLLKINPNTVSRALFSLEELGLITTQRTNGKFITDDEDIIKKFKNELADDTVKEFLENMKKLGFSLKEVIELIKGE